MMKKTSSTTVIVFCLALAMFWPIYWLSFLGLLLFLIMLGTQWIQRRRKQALEASPA